MAGRTVYSALLGTLDSIDDSGVPFLSVPSDETWVLRLFTATFGSYVAYVQAALSLSGLDPWLWLVGSDQGALIGVHNKTFVWEGRLVLPPNSVWWVKASSSDSCDVLASGYKLQMP